MNSFVFNKLPICRSVIGCFFKRNISSIFLSSANPLLHDNKQQQCGGQLERGCDFWEEQANKLRWFRMWDKVLDNSDPHFARWFVNGQMNTCFNAVDRHVHEGNGEDTAIYYDSQFRKKKATYSYYDLLQRTTALAIEMTKQGVRRGDVVLIYMPTIPEAIFAMLATARIGAVHCVTKPGLTGDKLATRINHCFPKLIVTSTSAFQENEEIGYLPIIQNALKIADFSPKSIFIHHSNPDFSKDVDLLKKDGHSTMDFQEILEAHSNQHFDCIPIQSTSPLYLIYNSDGKTAPLRSCGGNAVSLIWSMNSIYGVNPDETFATLTDLASIVGHSYICYGPLFHRSPTVLFEGQLQPPDEALFRLIDEYKLACLLTSSDSLRNARKEDPLGKKAANFNLKSLKRVFLTGTGQQLEPATLLWAKKRFDNKPIIDQWFLNESSCPIATNQLESNLKSSPSRSIGFATPGWKLEILRNDGNKCRPNENGRIAAQLPLPPGALSTLFKSDEGFVENYFKQFPGHFTTNNTEGSMDEVGKIFLSSIKTE